jgi:enterochelin esterase-like enzyme
MKFRKTVAGYDFQFEESRAMMEVVYIVELENYPFLMFADGDEWIIIGNVPPWIRELEPQLAEAIDSQLVQ